MGVSGSPSGDTLGTKNNVNNANGIRKSPGGDTLGTQNKKRVYLPPCRSFKPYSDNQYPGLQKESKLLC